jgi:hypothetical protein
MPHGSTAALYPRGTVREELRRCFLLVRRAGTDDSGKPADSIHLTVNCRSHFVTLWIAIGPQNRQYCTTLKSFTVLRCILCCFSTVTQQANAKICCFADHFWRLHTVGGPRYGTSYSPGSLEFCVKSDQANTISEVYVQGGYLKHVKLPMNIHWSDK